MSIYLAKKLNDEKLARFCVISDMDSTMSFLSSLFFSFLFIKVIRMADDSPTKMLKRELCILLDEFPNIGQIPDFQKKLATIRSRGVSCIIVCQSVSGLETLYPNNSWQGIVANSDLKIITGCNDIQTADYISRMLRRINR